MIADAKTALEEGSIERMESIYEQLTQASHQIAATLYQSAAAESGESGSPDTQAGGQSGGGGDDDVVDAEYVDVDAEEDK